MRMGEFHETPSHSVVFLFDQFVEILLEIGRVGSRDILDGAVCTRWLGRVRRTWLPGGRRCRASKPLSGFLFQHCFPKREGARIADSGERIVFLLGAFGKRFQGDCLIADIWWTPSGVCVFVSTETKPGVITGTPTAASALRQETPPERCVELPCTSCPTAASAAASNFSSLSMFQ